MAIKLIPAPAPVDVRRQSSNSEHKKQSSDIPKPVQIFRSQSAPISNGAQSKKPKTPLKERCMFLFEDEDQLPSPKSTPSPQKNLSSAFLEQRQLEEEYALLPLPQEENLPVPKQVAQNASKTPRAVKRLLDRRRAAGDLLTLPPSPEKGKRSKHPEDEQQGVFELEL
jgi:hypothetical protein